MPIGPGSFIGVTPGTGAKLATGPTYTENSNVVQDEKVLHGEPYLATYNALSSTTSGLSTATVNTNLFQVMAGASLKVYLRSMRIYQLALATTATFGVAFDVVRVTSAGTGGSAITPAPLDTADAASGATAMSAVVTPGTLTTSVDSVVTYFLQVLPTAVTALPLMAQFNWETPRSKGLVIPAGTTNGIIVRNRAAVAGATVVIVVQFVEASY